MSLIRVANLSKLFRIPLRKEGFFGGISSFFWREYVVKTALKNLSFSIEEGELLGYIGPNGAGKSTTIKILSGILVPDSGDVAVMDQVPWRERISIAREIGVVFGQRTQLWWDLPVIDSFKLLKEIYAIESSDYKRKLDELIQTLDLASLLAVPVRQLSLGQRMRCDLAASLLHSPKILFLDEPTIGLDAVSKLAIRDLIRQLNREQKITIFLTTHDMDDIEALCRRVLILNNGELFLDGSLDQLREKMAPQRRLIVDLTCEGDTVADEEAHLIKQEGHRVWLSFNPLTTSTPELIARVASRHAIGDLYVENPPIEEIIASLYRDVNL